MTVLSFKIECEGRPQSVNISDWRFMTDCIYYYGNIESTEGTSLILPGRMIDVMGYTPQMIRNAIADDKIVNNVIFTSNVDANPGWCPKCSGLGKLDWVSSAMKSRRNYNIDRHTRSRFKRNKERVLLYKSKRYTLGYNFDNVFAPVIVEENKAETLCKYCHGTGLNLDARHRLFGGMAGLRHNLKEFEWDGLNLPGI